MISSDTLSVRVLLDVNPQCAGVPDDIVEPTTRTLSQTDRWRGKVAFPKNGGTVKEGIGNWDEQNYQIARRSLEKRNLRGFTEDEAILRQGDIRSSSKTRTVRGSITAAYSPGGMLGKTRSGGRSCAAQGKLEAKLLSNSSGQDGPPHPNHMNHVGEKGHVSEFHCSLVQQPISIEEAVKSSTRRPRKEQASEL